MASTEIRCPSCGVLNRLPVTASGRPRCGKCHTDLPWLTDAAGDEFDQILAASRLAVLVDLWAPWCGPCRAVAPALEHLASERAGSLRVVKVNVDSSPEISARLGVQGIPTMLLYRNGIELARQVGALPGPQIARWVDDGLSKPITAVPGRNADSSS
jgi:thioredoxin 2